MLRFERRFFVGDETVDEVEVELDRFPDSQLVHPRSPD